VADVAAAVIFDPSTGVKLDFFNSKEAIHAAE
jgi:hypothetical protein